MAGLVTEQLKELPASPGVYLMKDAGGEILYVGKAVNLRNRVRSYFRTGRGLSPKQQRLVARINDIDFYVTPSEQEALILELNLIKRHHPRYNVSLRDDKTFPYLKIDTGEDWPRVQVTRRVQDDGARYFGPFASARSVRRTLKALKRIFPFRACSKRITGNEPRACLEYFVNNCTGPCIGAVSKDEYGQVIDRVILFLEGKQESVIRQLEGEMRQASGALNFEKAALLRDRIEAARNVVEGQQIAIRLGGEQDVIALASDRNQSCAQVFFIRRGRLIGRESFTLNGTRHEEPRGIMTSFVEQFYASSTYVPPLLLLQYPVENRGIIEGWLQGRRGSKVRILVPRRGSKKQMVDIVAENARRGLEQTRIRQLASSDVLKTALAEIKRGLQLPEAPLRIEGYDISDIQGMAAVGSMVVFEGGRSVPSRYRRFRIRTVAGANDYAMLQEVLRRRFRRLGDAAGAWAELPGLVLVDGGKGQLNAALAVIREAGMDMVPVASLAKENEEIFIPGRAKPVVLPRQSPGLQLLQRVRDEAHRFAVAYYQRVHRREAFNSVLDAIPGVGARRKHALLRQFGSVPAIRDASVEELAATRGMNKSLAQRVKEYV